MLELVLPGALKGSLDMSNADVERGWELPRRGVLAAEGCCVGVTLCPFSAMYARPLVGMPCDCAATRARPSLEPRRLSGRRLLDVDDVLGVLPVVAEAPKWAFMTVAIGHVEPSKRLRLPPTANNNTK